MPNLTYGELLCMFRILDSQRNLVTTVSRRTFTNNNGQTLDQFVDDQTGQIYMERPYDAELDDVIKHLGMVVFAHIQEVNVELGNTNIST